MNYHVKVKNFEGPINLLLFFTQRDQLNIYDIPIAYIVREFLKYMNIIGYLQPVTKSEIESIRGVECGSVINTLMERGLVRVKGRRNTAGRPLLFSTTRLFLETFGLEKISDLPKLKELSEMMSDKENPNLFIKNHALE